MAKLTREQYERWNAQAKNGFEFDLHKYLVWSEKQLTKKFDADNGSYFKVDLYYKEETETITNQYGCKHVHYTGRFIPTANISYYRPSTTEGVYTSLGLGKFVTVGNPQDKKKYNILCTISGMPIFEALIADCEQELRNADGRIL